jgi:hypothetical protein
MAAACGADIVDWLPPHTQNTHTHTHKNKRKSFKIQTNIITTHVAVIISN